jgi:low temperature requirement protein LtrA
MVARSPHEPHRVATPLELFFDLVFVVAIAMAANELHHAVTESHAAQGLIGYGLVFFAIWWAWVNFTWFASAYDCDDVPYRLTVFVQLTGALIMASGVPGMFEHRMANWAIVGGYVVMRSAGVAQWLRAAKADPPRRVTALRYAVGITAVQIGWIAAMFAPSIWIPEFLALAAVEMLVPAWAERAEATTWHPHHIAERYGLLTMIVLGESILAATSAVQSAIASGAAGLNLLPVIVGGLLIVCSMWWIYFDRPLHGVLTSLPKALMWGYGHYFIFAAAAAVGAGLAAAVDVVTHEAHTTMRMAGAAVAIPVAVYVLCLWTLHYRPEFRRTRPFGPLAAALVLLTPFTPQPVLFTGLVIALLVAVKLLLVGSHPHTEA